MAYGYKSSTQTARLDNIVKAAKDNKLHVVFSLTNNWFRNATGTIGGDSKHKKRR